MLKKGEELGLAIHHSAIERVFASVGHVLVAYLFGSQARGQAGPLSDVDFAVLFDKALPEDRYLDTQLQLMDELGRAVEHDEVDIVVLNQAPLALAYRVLRDGILVFCSDEDARVQFTARTVIMYLDFKPVIERHEHAILERARRGELLNGYNPHRGALERYRQLRERLKGASDSDV
ncbi:MAG: nucleotidyltransferase domain-containing protein [Anaerolineae bacterium]